MVRNILVYPDPFLSRKAAPVTKIDERIKELIRDMFDTMYESEGIGLAATQVGVDRRVIVLDVSPSDESGVPMALVNPEIVGSEGPTTVCMEGFGASAPGPLLFDKFGFTVEHVVDVAKKTVAANK